MRLATYRRLLAVSLKVLGPGRTFLAWLVFMPLYFVFTRLTMALDHLFFPQLRRIRVSRPVFIIGHPRSGTTLLHRMLTEGGSFCSFRTWELIFPALTARRLIKPFLERLRRRRRTLVPASVGHEISLEGVEEEEFLFLHCLDTQFLLTRTPLVFDELEHPELRLHDIQPARARRRSVRFFEACLKRQLLATGKDRVAAQLHFSVHRVRTLLEAFPDARFIYLQRSPLETIPSHLSLVKSSLAYQWGEDRFTPESFRGVVERRYQASVDLYAYSRTLFEEGILNDENTLVLPYAALSAELQSAMARVFEFLEHEPTAAHRRHIQRQSVQQAQYRRPHSVLPLRAFGLSEARVREDLGFAFRPFRARCRRAELPPAAQALPQALGGDGEGRVHTEDLQGRGGPPEERRGPVGQELPFVPTPG